MPLSEKQKKLPPALQKAILAKDKKAPAKKPAKKPAMKPTVKKPPKANY